MHGCHETMLDNPQIDLSFPDRFKAMLGRVQAWVPTAEKNKRVFKRHGEPARQTRIVNGIEVKPAAPLSRDKLGLREDALVLCLATRAIEEKGWFAAVEMVKRLNADGLAVDLMLIGEGPAADAVAAEAPPYVRLYGQVANLQDYIVTADVGLLPSFFAGESMPLVLLEMMAQGLPVIATDVGDIPVILGEGPQAGGAIVPLKGKTVDVDGFVAEIRKLATPAARQAAGARAKTCFEKTYTMDGMVGAYRSLYRDALS
jgi:glycosyltransferase involved in cell wall biosynthesis